MSEALDATETLPEVSFIGQVIPDDDGECYWFVEFQDGKCAEIPASEAGLDESKAVRLARMRRHLRSAEDV